MDLASRELFDSGEGADTAYPQFADPAAHRSAPVRHPHIRVVSGARPGIDRRTLQVSGPNVLVYLVVSRYAAVPGF